MATGRLTSAMPTEGGDTTHGNRTFAEEPWSTTAGNVYKKRVWEDLRNLFQIDKLTDVMLAAEGQSIPCHRVLLAAASKFFYDKLVIHAESLDNNRLEIEGIEFDTLAAVVYFVYNGRVELTVQKTEKLIPASVSVMLLELTNMCKDFLLDKVHQDQASCINIHRFAKSNCLLDVLDRAWQMMLQNIQDVSKVDAFMEMSETDLQNYISDEGLNGANENPVFDDMIRGIGDLALNV